MFLLYFLDLKTPNKSGIPGVPYVSILVQNIFGVISLTFFQKVDSLPRFTEGVVLFFFGSLGDRFSFLNNPDLISLDKTESDSKFFLLWFKFVAIPSNGFAIYNSAPIRCFNIKIEAPTILRINNNNIYWSLFANVFKNQISFFKKSVDRFVLADRSLVLPRIHYPPLDCSQ